MSQPTTSKESGNHHTLVTQTIVDGKISVITSSQSLLRVFLLGPFAIEQASGVSLNLDTLLGRSQSSILFKLLLCHPERRVIRERLIDALWPGQPHNAMAGSLGVAKSILKTRLEMVCGQPIMPRVSGDPPVYSLADQAVIWTDIDACEQFIRQAINTKSARNALPLWEAAYSLLQRGTLLSGDRAAYWYQASLVEDRRKRLVRQRMQCVLRIADLALECKDLDRTVAVLNEESEADPANEEIVLHLMEFLARYGRHNEALQCYARLEAALLEQDTEPQSTTRTLAQQLRSIATTKVSLERHALLIPLQAESQIEGEREIKEESPDSELQLPQQAPSSWTVPYPRNSFFTGRQELLAHIHDQLHRIPAVAVTQAQAICGLGGIGKTQTALEYAYRYRQEYQAIFWVKADTHENLLAGFLAIASLLHLPAQSAGDHAVTSAAVKHWFQCHEQWLLILDNADDLALVREFLPSGHQGHVLLTTRMQAVGGLAYSVQVEEMDQEVGAIFLLRRAGLLPPDTSILDKTTADSWLAQEFVREVGGLPLALDQAGAYIEETASSLQEYLGLYHTHRLALLQRRGGLTIDHPESVATTWAVAFTHLENNNPVAADLLRLCAFLDPDAIPEEILIEGAEAAPLDPLQMNEALAVLMRFSLIRRNIQTRTLTIHRLVQTVIQDTMDEEMQRYWGEKVIYILYHIFPHAITVSNWHDCQRCLPHVLTGISYIKQWNFAFSEAAQLLNQAGYYLKEQAHYVDAELFYQEALVIREGIFGIDNPETVQSIYNLARLYFEQGRYEEAERLYLQTVRIRERILGNEHPNLAQSLNSLALLYWMQGRYEEAEPLFQQAISIREQVMGPEHPETAHCLNNLALLFTSQGKYEEAEHLHLRVLAIRQKVLPSNHLDIAQSLQNLASLYLNRGDHSKYHGAEELLLQSQAIREKILGSEHPQTAKSLHNLALLYEAQGRYAEAEQLYLQALAIREKVLGQKNAKTIATIADYIPLLRKIQKEKEAEVLEERMKTYEYSQLRP